MCARFSLARVERFARDFASYRRPDIQPRYNIAPTSRTLVKRNDGTNELTMMRWGLVPSWAQDVNIGTRMINARGETAAEKPSFRTALRRHRCLVPASSFFEWRSTATGKEPVMFSMRSGVGALRRLLTRAIRNGPLTLISITIRHVSGSTSQNRVGLT
jgi:putative SOS response-associated peptidase YedK